MAMTEPEPSRRQKAAFAAGKAAHTAGFPPTVCPHEVTDTDPERLGKLWVRGYVRAKLAAPSGNLGPAPAGLPKPKVVR